MGPDKSLCPLVRGQGQGQPSKTEHFRTIATLFQANITEGNCDPIPTHARKDGGNPRLPPSLPSGDTTPFLIGMQSENDELGAGAFITVGCQKDPQCPLVSVQTMGGIWTSIPGQQ